MAKLQRKDNFKSLREMFAYLICWRSSEPLVKMDQEIVQMQTLDFTDFSGNATRMDTSCAPKHISHSLICHQQAYPEHLNPFADDIDDIIIDLPETRYMGSISDYPDELNPFSDDDDDDDDAN